MYNQNEVLDKAIKWIKKNTINGNGICVTSNKQHIYPEVTGYYIPTLLQWGEDELAQSYAKYLISIQKQNGSWYDSDDIAPYIFDSAQILKGLVAIRELMPEADEAIRKGCDWILSCMTPEGRLETPTKEAWEEDTFCSELVHLYCLTPLIDAGHCLGNESYSEKADKIKEYYVSHNREKIASFHLLSHFYAYVMEGLWDLGEHELVNEAMYNIKKFQNSQGAVTGLNNVSWVCSTGLFQLALVWYKMGEKTEGDRLFDSACELQNESGGWYGSYPVTLKDKLRIGKKRPSYFPDEEISWADKYFLDALYYKKKLEKQQ